ncbi:MAG: major capsid protein [Gammaproteobacteria bacterium]|nr:major capsid protein [Gammaproteobacteria bacterium]
MPQQTPSQARVIDPILTTVAQGYKNADMVGDALFPVVPVDQRGGKIVSFSREDFRLYATGRAPGANTKRVQYGYASTPYALEQHALEGQVPFELMQDAAAVPGIDQGSIAVMKTQNIIALRTEKARADIATTAGSYGAANKVTLSGTDQWSDPAASDPNGDIETAKDAVRAKTGRRANTVVLGAAVFAALKVHSKIIDRIKYTGRDVVTTDLLAALWDVRQVRVGDAVYENDAGALVDVWGKFVVVAYTELGSMADMGLPSYGYTYRLRSYPIVEQPYQDRNAKSWIYPVTDELSPVMAAADAGYLISAAVA